MALAERGRAVVRRVLGAGGPLVGGRVVSAAMTFALPLVLARLLAPEAFGTYKQFFLIIVTLQLTGQLGLTQSLYYFIPRGGKERGAFISQSFLSLALLGLAAGIGLWLLTPLLGRWLGDGTLMSLRLPLALCGGMQLAAAALESALISDGRIGIAGITYVVADGMRAVALVVGARYFGPAGLFWAAALTSLTRVFACVGLVATRTVPWAAPRRDLFRAQLAYSLPFAGSCYLYVAQRYFSQYAVSASFDTATFALFAVASFHMPVVDIVFTPMAEVMMVHIGKAHHAGQARGVWAAWNDTTQKLAALLFPAAACAWLFGPVVLPLLFTHKYDGSVPLFMIATAEIPLWVLPLDALLRAHGDTRYLFGFNAVRVVVTAALVLGGIHAFGLAGALAGGVVAEALSRVALLARGRRFLGVGLGHAIDWTAMARTAAAAAGACVPAYALAQLPLGRVTSVLTAGAGYIVAYVTLLFQLRVESSGLRVPDQI